MKAAESYSTISTLEIFLLEMIILLRNIPSRETQVNDFMVGYPQALNHPNIEKSRLTAVILCRAYLVIDLLCGTRPHSLSPPNPRYPSPRSKIAIELLIHANGESIEIVLSEFVMESNRL